MPIDDLIPLPPEDPDALLARRLDDGRELSADDPFERTLVVYRAAARRTAPTSAYSQRIWNNIRPERTSLRLVSAPIRWVAIAASVLLFSFAAWLLSRNGPTTHSAGVDIALVSLSDGSSVSLRPRTSLSEIDDHTYLLEGEAFFDVAPHPRRVFRVRSAIGEVRVLGTRFDVSTWGKTTTIFLESGRVVFSHFPSGSVDTLAPGEELAASSTGFSVRQASDHGKGSTDWLENVLILGRRPVSQIIAEMEHHFGISVIVPDSVKTETLSGRIQLSSPRQGMFDLGIALGAHFEEAESNVFRYSMQ